LVVCKNAGGSGAEAKLIAARHLGVPVLMIDRPVLPERRESCDPAAVLDWLLHDSAAERGV
ncbi:cobalt-precorrin-6A reductase, partial [Salmonella enterica subsp. enterica serovar Enteritidis]|nr:cobalt-precorrin-6A reductase [Salmonella enterica subsp. enterica serovar Enteritidis]